MIIVNIRAMYFFFVEKTQDFNRAERQKSSTVGLLINPDDLHLSLRLDTVRYEYLRLRCHNFKYSSTSDGGLRLHRGANFKSVCLKVGRILCDRTQSLSCFRRMPVDFCWDFEF